MNIDYIALGEEFLSEIAIFTNKDEIREFFNKKQKEQDSKVVQLSSKDMPKESTGWKAREALHKILNNKDYPIDQCDKVLVLQLYDKDDQYDIKFANVGMKMSECISLCELSKTLFKNDMGY